MARCLALGLCLLLFASSGCGSRRGRIPSPPRGGSVSIGPPMPAARPPVARSPAKSPRTSKEPAIRLNEATGSFEVVNLKQADVDKLAKASLSQEQWKDLLSVY